jgi:hypothetical protein
VIESKIIFPRAFAFSVDDIGWNEGSNLSKNSPPGPRRAGADRTFGLNDYINIVDVAKSVNVRVQCLFVLSEMDRENTLAKYPTTTYMRNKWDNSRLKNDEQFRIMKYVQNSSSHLEFGFHGTGHEYWDQDGKMYRAEWYNLINRKPWPECILEQHINGFREIMTQYDISVENGHTFPESFVPCAYSYYWNPGGEYSLGKLLVKAGVKFACTDFGKIPELLPPEEVNGGGFDHGLHVINRMNYGNLYHEFCSLPKVPVEFQETDIIESHWVNWLANDNALLPEVTNLFVNYYKSIQRLHDRYLAKNTEQLHSQWLYKKYTRIIETRPGLIDIDNRWMPDEAYQNHNPGNMVLKIRISEYQHVSKALLNNKLIPSYYEDEGFAFFYLPPLGKERYQLSFTIGGSYMPVYILNDGTYNIYNIESADNKMIIDMKMYGIQVVKVRCKRPIKVISDTKVLNVVEVKYLSDKGLLYMSVCAQNIQGNRGNVIIEY